MLTTVAGTRFHAGAVVIAGGLGSFQPRRLGVAGSEAFEGRHIHYEVRDAGELHGKQLVIFGGGDSALDWALEFARQGAQRDARASSPGVPRRSPRRARRCATLVARGSMRYVEGMRAFAARRGRRFRGVQRQGSRRPVA